MSWTPKFFKDLGKDVADLFSDKTYNLKRAVVVKTHSGSANFEAKTVVDQNAAVSSTLKAKEVLDKNYGSVEVTGVTNGEASCKYTNGSLLDGLDMTLEAGQTPKAKGSSTDETVPFYALGLKYKHSSFATALDASYGDASGGALKGSFVFGWEGVAAGVEGELKQAGGDLKLSDYNAVLHYEKDGLNATFKTADSADTLVGLLSHDVSRDTSVAFGMNYKLSDSSKKSIFVGGTTRLDNVSKVKGFLASDGTLSALYAHELTSSARLELSSTSNVPACFGGKAQGCQWGLKLTLGDL